MCAAWTAVKTAGVSAAINKPTSDILDLMVMRMSDWRTYASVALAALVLLAIPETSSAQYRPVTTGPPIGEDYHIEASYNWWNAEPTLIVNSEALGILGTDVDLISDLGITKHRLGVLDLVLKPSKKHRLKYQHLPIKYTTDAFPVQRSFIFNGQRYNVGLPVTTTVDFSTDSFGYEYDFLYFKRGFVGANINLKLTNIDVDLQSPIGAEFFKQAAPIPAYGFAGRGYVTPNFAIDSTLTFFRIPESLEEQLEGDGSYTDFDLHGTYNVNKYVGAQLGWRKTAIFYTTAEDTGDLKFKGFYFGGVVRY
jgi:hypothetical protein